MTFQKRTLPILILFLAFASPSPAQMQAPSPAAGPTGIGGETQDVLTIMPPMQFSVDERLRRHVDFWIRVYTEFDSHQGLIHDAKYIDHIYEVVNLDPSEERTGKAIREAKRRWREVLLALHRKTRDQDKIHLEDFTPDERKVYDLFADINEPDKFLRAAHRKRLRFQLGQKDHFLDGLRQSGRYLPVMEEVFRKEGLPTELTRLPFVESSFNARARSKVGASGIWQFMPSTGRLFLTINGSVDERNDPIRATEAAAQLLKLNFQSLGSWPLAVTAYNHGRKGLMRAVRSVGSDELEDLVSEYRGRAFGFASTNFFTELLAAIEVEKNSARYFGAVERAKPMDPKESFEVMLPRGIPLTELERFLKVDGGAVQSLNPGLTEAALRGSRAIPAGYRLRLPRDAQLQPEAAARVFLAGFEQIPSIYKVGGHSAVKYGKRPRAIAE